MRCRSVPALGGERCWEDLIAAGLLPRAALTVSPSSPPAGRCLCSMWLY